MLSPNAAFMPSVQVVESLRKILADTHTLYVKVHGFHWNVTGFRFNDLHAFFGSQYNELFSALDELGERIRKLGQKAPSSMAELMKLASIKESSSNLNAQEMLKSLLEGHQTLTISYKNLFVISEQGKDYATMDLATKRIESHEKSIWMLRSLLE
jgi:starvation-inducible DNA-binding protein